MIKFHWTFYKFIIKWLWLVFQGLFIEHDVMVERLKALRDNTLKQLNEWKENE